MSRLLTLLSLAALPALARAEFTITNNSSDNVWYTESYAYRPDTGGLAFEPDPLRRVSGWHLVKPGTSKDIASGMWLCIRRGETVLAGAGANRALPLHPSAFFTLDLDDRAKYTAKDVPRNVTSGGPRNGYTLGTGFYDFAGKGGVVVTDKSRAHGERVEVKVPTGYQALTFSVENRTKATVTLAIDGAGSSQRPRLEAGETKSFQTRSQGDIAAKAGVVRSDGKPKKFDVADGKKYVVSLDGEGEPGLFNWSPPKRTVPKSGTRPAKPADEEVPIQIDGAVTLTNRTPGPLAVAVIGDAARPYRLNAGQSLQVPLTYTTPNKPQLEFPQPDGTKTRRPLVGSEFALELKSPPTPLGGPPRKVVVLTKVR